MMERNGNIPSIGGRCRKPGVAAPQQAGEPVEKDLVPNASRLYVFFGGLAAGIVMPPFEFYESAKIVRENKIFVRDFGQCWYQSGLPGISHDIDSTAQYLREEIDRIHPKKVIFAGNSMGGYAAILFSALLGRGEAIAFAPQTFISPVLRLRHRDIRWPRQIANTWLQGVFRKRYWDLRRVLLQAGAGRKVSIFVSREHRLDYVHAKHLESVGGARIFEFDGAGHGIVKLLRDQGKLASIMLGDYC